MNLKLFMGLLLMVLLCQCVSFPKYPTHWSPPVPEGSRIESQIVGDYHCQGINEFQTRDLLTPPDLRSFLNIEDIQKAPCAVVHFGSPEPGKLDVKIYRDNQLEAEGLLVAGRDYQVEKGRIKFKGQWIGEGDGGAAIIAKQNNSATLTQQGDLIIKTSNIGLGVFVIVPIVGGGHNWALFKRVPCEGHGG